MMYNILNGDALAYSFPEAQINGQISVVREGLIYGDLSGNNLQEFGQARAKYQGIKENEYYNLLERNSKNN